jgi:hypothetical protein
VGGDGVSGRELKVDNSTIEDAGDSLDANLSVVGDVGLSRIVCSILSTSDNDMSNANTWSVVPSQLGHCNFVWQVSQTCTFVFFAGSFLSSCKRLASFHFFANQ